MKSSTPDHAFLRWGLMLGRSKTWDEDKHPRDHGKFATAEGGTENTKGSVADRVKAWMDSQDAAAESTPPSKADGTITDKEHQTAAASLTREGKALLAAAWDWGEAKPWDASYQEIERGSVPGITTGSYGGRGHETAHHEDGVLVLTPKFFELKDSLGREGVIWHELGHQLSDTMLHDGTAFRLVDADLMPKEFDGQNTPGEILAQAYSVLLTEPDYLQKHAPGLVGPLKDRATSLGMPVTRSRVPSS